MERNSELQPDIYPHASVKPEPLPSRTRRFFNRVAVGVGFIGIGTIGAFLSSGAPEAHAQNPYYDGGYNAAYQQWSQQMQDWTSHCVVYVQGGCLGYPGSTTRSSSEQVQTTIADTDIVQRPLPFGGSETRVRSFQETRRTSQSRTQTTQYPGGYYPQPGYPYER